MAEPICNKKIGHSYRLAPDGEYRCVRLGCTSVMTASPGLKGALDQFSALLEAVAPELAGGTFTRCLCDELEVCANCERRAKDE